MAELAVVRSLEPHTPEWRAWRRGGIGGSDAAVITGDDPFTSPYSLWLDKSGHLLDRAESSDEPQWWGRKLETAVIERFEHDTDLHVVKRQLCIEAAGANWRRATLDGLVCENWGGGEPLPEALGIFEGKTASRRAHEWRDGPPTHVQLQVQHNLDVAGLDHAWLAVLLTTPVIHFELFEIERDESILRPLRRLEERFWRRVLEGDPPPVTWQDRSAVASAFANSVKDELQLPADAERFVEQLRDARERKRDAERDEDAAVAQLGVLLQEHETGLDEHGLPMITWKRQSRTYVDLEALAANEPAIYAKHQRKTFSRVMRIPKRFQPARTNIDESAEPFVGDTLDLFNRMEQFIEREALAERFPTAVKQAVRDSEEDDDDA